LVSYDPTTGKAYYTFNYTDPSTGNVNVISSQNPPPFDATQNQFANAVPPEPPQEPSTGATPKVESPVTPETGITPTPEPTDSSQGTISVGDVSAKPTYGTVPATALGTPTDTTSASKTGGPSGTTTGPGDGKTGTGPGKAPGDSGLGDKAGGGGGAGGGGDAGGGPALVDSSIPIAVDSTTTKPEVAKPTETPKATPTEEPDTGVSITTSAVKPKIKAAYPTISGQFASPLTQAISAYRPAGEIESQETGKERQDVWNVESLRNALGI
jgi:hypothetical protein